MYKMYFKLKFKKVLGGKTMHYCYILFLANIRGDTGWLSPNGIQS